MTIIIAVVISVLIEPPKRSPYQQPNVTRSATISITDQNSDYYMSGQRAWHSIYFPNRFTRFAFSMI